MTYDNPILLSAAVIPAIFLLVQIYRADKLEKEPVSMVIGLVFWGAVSTIPAVICEKLGIFLLSLVFPPEGLAFRLLLNLLVIGGAEEGFKYRMLRRRTWNSREFNCQFDGVVYAAAISLGFALWENIGYVFSYGLATALLRAVTAVPGHCCFGIFMGAFYGLARRYENFGETGKSRTCRRLAVLIPMLLHGAYDFIAALEQELFALTFVVFVGVMFFTASRMVRRLSENDRFIRARQEYFS